MMNRFTKYLGVGLLALSMAAFVPVSTARAADEAKTLRIAVVDIQALLKDSKAAVSIEKQVSGMRTSFQAEVEKAEKDLRTKEQSILAEREKLSEADLKTKVEGFQKDVAAGQKKIQDRKAALDKSVSDALNKLRGEIVKVVADIGEKQNLDLVLARTDVVIVDKSLDITADVLKRIDTTLPDVKVK